MGDRLMASYADARRSHERTLEARAVRLARDLPLVQLYALEGAALSYSGPRKVSRELSELTTVLRRAIDLNIAAALDGTLERATLDQRLSPHVRNLAASELSRRKRAAQRQVCEL
jgi:hypothetical protein